MCVSLMKQQDKGEGARNFLVSDRCIFGGVCAKVYPAANIHISKQISFGNQCESCYACIHACPQNATHLPSEKSSARWQTL